MRLGLQVNNFNWQGGPATLGADLANIARRAEAAGFDSFWVMDHFFQLGEERNGVTDQNMLEAYTTLGYIAGVTSTMQLGTMVTGVTYRHPGLLVKTVTPLDVLSGGRAYLGIGAGWFEREHVGLGVPLPPVKERFERLEETLQIAKQMWSGEGKPYEGRHFRLAETLCQPLPLSKPHLPILIGGGGEQKTLRLVATYGDACNLFSRDLDIVAHKLDVLRGHYEAQGRPYAEIEKTTLGGLPGLMQVGDTVSYDRGQAAEYLARLAALGVDQHLLSVADASSPALAEVLGEVSAQATALYVAG